MLKLYHPELLLKIWYVSNSKENALNASKEMTNVIAMSKEEYFRKIGIGYNLEFDENGLVKVNPDDYIEDENGINHFKNITINEGIETPTLIFFDEVSSFSQLDLLLSEDFLKAKNIYTVAAGDFDLIGALGMFENSEGDEIYIRLSSSNFIGSWKLGSSMRSNNVDKAKNISVARESLNKYLEKLLSLSLGFVTTPIRFSYYESSGGLYGDKVISDGNWEQSIRTMLDTLEEGEKLNYISDDLSTELYQTLKSLNEGGKYQDKINFLNAKASQGLEGQYYVIELTNSFRNAINNSDDSEIAINFGKTIYTAISRAKQGSLIVGDYTNESDFTLFDSIKLDTLQSNNLSPLIIQSFGEERKSILKEALGDVNETTELKRDISPVEEEPLLDNNPSGDDITEEEVNLNNLDKPNTIDNSEEGKLYILMHSFMCLETGCNITGGKEPTDPNVTLSLGQFFGDRIDNLNGLAQINKRSNGQIELSGVKIDDNGNIVEGKDLLLLKLNQIRNFACYTKDKLTLIGLIQLILGTTVPIRIDFAYKNQFRSYTSEDETIKWFEEHPEYKKFYKGKTEYLAGIFNLDNIEDTIREPKDLVVEIIVTLSDGTQLLEVPLCKMTSPLTLLNNSQFAGLKLVYDDVGQNESNFKKEVKKLLQQNSNIPHLKEYGLLLELWEHSAFNTISYFDDDFVLANYTKVTGITTVSHEKGKDYFNTLSYYYNGRWMTLEDYKLRMPWRKISHIFTSVELDGRNVVELNGTEIQVGKPFVLVSDYYTNLSDTELLKIYLQQCKNKSEPLIRLVYVTPPTASIEEYIFNLNNALTKNKDNIENVNRDLGTKITAFRLLQFVLDKNSKFRAAFESWNNNTPTEESYKKGSINRLEAIANLVLILSKYDKKKLYEILNTPIVNLDSSLKNALKYTDGKGEEKWVMGISSTLTLRHIFQSELHKMLLSDLFYGDSISSKILKKIGGKIVFNDSVNGKVEAFIEDCKLHNWNGVQFHLKLKPDSTLTIFDLSFAEIDTELGSEYSVSQKPIQINGKLDSTSFILDAVPLMEWVIRGGLGRDPQTISSDNTSTNIFAEKYKKLKDYNTRRYLNLETPPKKKDPIDERFLELLKDLEFPKGHIKENKTKLSSAFDLLSDEEKTLILQDPRQFIFNITGLLSKVINNKLSIVKNLNDALDIIYLDDNILFRRSSDLNKVYTLTDQKEIIPINYELFLEMTKNLKPNFTLTTLALILQLKNDGHLLDPDFNVQEALSRTLETFLKSGGFTSNINLEEILKNIQFLANPRRIARLSNIYEKDPQTGQWTFTNNGIVYATILALTGPNIYNKLVNDASKHDILENLLSDLSKTNLDFIKYIEQLIKELNNDICSFKTPF